MSCATSARMTATTIRGSGLEIIRGMKQEGDDKYVGGTILDPRDGKVYSAMMTVTPDGQTLVVRGYIGFSLLGRKSILDALAGFRLQHARSLDQSQSCRQSGALPGGAQIANPVEAGKFRSALRPSTRHAAALAVARLAHQDGLEQRRRRHRRQQRDRQQLAHARCARDGWKTTGCRRRSPSSAR